MRPIYHYVDRRIRAHVAVCFLAYVMEMAIRQALGKNGVLSEKDYHAVMEDLRRTTALETRQSANGLRTRLTDHPSRSERLYNYV